MAVGKILRGTAIRAIAPTAETAIWCGQSTCGCYVRGRAFSRCSPTPTLGRLCNSKYPADNQVSGAPDGWNGQIDERVAARAIGTVNPATSPIGEVSLRSVSNDTTPSTIVALSGARGPEMFGRSGIALYSAVRLIDNANASARAENQTNILR